MDYRIKNILIAITLFLTIVLLSCVCVKCQAQDIRREGNTFIEVSDSVNQKKMYTTEYMYREKDGTLYPVYLSSSGNAFIVKVSKRTGKTYRKYLPEVTKQIHK